ncbi:hypothetical protein [Comamonas sp. UBA7528]|uniref:hypothetical protein n=1 Tax=Comamonas sp. UBA7528 TaxID=1946391 RepID=UPI0025C222DE|nr:hypothetical protein [Comamonas sp. UBA7528]
MAIVCPSVLSSGKGLFNFPYKKAPAVTAGAWEASKLAPGAKQCSNGSTCSQRSASCHCCVTTPWQGCLRSAEKTKAPVIADQGFVFGCEGWI